MNRPLGLVLCGGASSRMGTDKGLLNYHGIPQRDYAKKLLSNFCQSVVLSSGNYDLEREDAFQDLSPYNNTGPIGGLLTIHHYFPSRDILVLACDYPLLRKQCLEYLLASKEPLVKLFKNQSSFPEPLVGFYSVEALEKIKEAFLAGEQSLRRIISSWNVSLSEPPDKYCVVSADHPEDHLRVLEIIQSGNLNFA